MKKLIFNTILILVLLLSGGLIFMSKNNPTGIRSFTVLSGSMEPTILTGSIVLTQPKSEYKKDDIIAFNQNGQIISHRIIKAIKTAADIKYATKGDANNTPDNDFVSDSSVIGKEFFSIPFIGYISLFLKTLTGLIIFIILPTLLFIMLEVFNIISELKKIRVKTNLI